MNTSPTPHSAGDSVGSPTPPEQPMLKLTFYNLVSLLGFDYPTLQLIATMAGVEQYVMDTMFTTVAIHRANAAKILAAFSEYTHQSYTFDTVKVALHPTFSNIVDTHKFDLAVLATGSGVPYTIVDMMLTNEPVPAKEAHLVLQIVSRLSRYHYALNNVDVHLSNDSEPHA